MCAIDQNERRERILSKALLKDGGKGVTGVHSASGVIHDCLIKHMTLELLSNVHIRAVLV